jgi:hypothetical protein
MAWTSPITFVTGTVVTAATLNSQIRDNLSFLFDPPAARIFSASPSVASGTTPVAVALGSVVYDSTGSAMTGTANKLTAPTAGLYSLAGSGVWAASGTGAVRRLGFILPGPTQEAVSLVENSNTVTVEQSTSDLAKLSANDTVQLAAAQNSGGAQTLSGATLTMAWAGAG